MTRIKHDEQPRSSPAARGGAGTYIEGEIGAFYMLSMLSNTQGRGLPGASITQVRFQGEDLGFALDDIIIHGTSKSGQAILEIQSKRTITFAANDEIFQKVCIQISNSFSSEVPAERHRLAVATQRTSKSISGPYQDVLEWAREADNGAQFFQRIKTKGIAGPEMRKFGETFRKNLMAAGFEDDDEKIWQIIRRFSIIEFDFESSAPMARSYALLAAARVLSPEDANKVESLWSNLIEISIAKGKSGGVVGQVDLRQTLVERGFQLAGEVNYSPAKIKLADMSRHARAAIGDSVAGMRLPRHSAVKLLNASLEMHRFIEIRGGPGVGKSGVLKGLAQRASNEAHVFVLDPTNTPGGGWLALGNALGVLGTAREFLIDLALSGGSIIFIDSLEMFTAESGRRTINELLREAASITGFSVVTTARLEFGSDGDNWLAQEAIDLLGVTAIVKVEELNEEEVDALRAHAPELNAILAPNHAAAPIARNLYHLSQLLKAPSSTGIRTEVDLANLWWRKADHADELDRRAARQLMAELADASMRGDRSVEVREDSRALKHLLKSQTLAETQRDRMKFYHDVLTDWAIGARLHDRPDAIGGLNLNAPTSQHVMRGIEFSGRFALELAADDTGWLQLLEALSPAGSHGSWRRHALMALVRSELAENLMERSTNLLLRQNGKLLIELCLAIRATETVSFASVWASAAEHHSNLALTVPQSMRMATTTSAVRVVGWCTTHATEIPIHAISSVLKLVEVLYFVLLPQIGIGTATAKMLFAWLLKYDTEKSVPGGSALDFSGDDRRRMIEDLRMMAFVLSSHSTQDLKDYLSAVLLEDDTEKVNKVRELSSIMAPVAAAEIAALIEASLIEKPGQRHERQVDASSAFTFADNDYMPVSPSQPPFFDILVSDATIGLNLVRKLVDRAVEFYFDRDEPDKASSITIYFQDGARKFAWIETYGWSRGIGRDYAVASALMALEAWGHKRIEAGDDIGDVIADILGPHTECAAYLLVAVDILLSHWPTSRSRLIPLVACPELLAIDHARILHERPANSLAVRDEPSGKVRLAELQAKSSRRILLESALRFYSTGDNESNRVHLLLKEAVERIGEYGPEADFSDAEFMAWRFQTRGATRLITAWFRWGFDPSRSVRRKAPAVCANRGACVGGC